MIASVSLTYLQSYYFLKYLGQNLLLKKKNVAISEV
jgi:hypothetical protein